MQALDHVFGYGVGLDMTRRDLQGEAKKMGRPWEIGKAFEDRPRSGPLRPVSEVGHPASGLVQLKVNGEAEADRRPEPDDLEGARDDLVPVGLSSNSRRAT